MEMRVMHTVRRPQAATLRAQEVGREWLALTVLASALSLISLYVLAVAK
jgi:hypothetical protein